jgi:uncharacterized protein (TIGR03435 family)
LGSFAAIAIGLACMAGAQTRAEFDVTSIRPNKSGPRANYDNRFIFSPSGRFVATSATLTELIILAYQTRPIQMQGGPDWLDVDRFDVAAKAGDAGGPVQGAQFSAMIQTMPAGALRLISAMHDSGAEG